MPHRIFQIPAEFFFLTSTFFVFYSFVHVFVLSGRHVYSLCQQAGAKSSGEYKRYQFRRSERYFCELHIRGIEGHVMVEDDFSEVYRKIKEISPRVNNTGEGVSEGSGCASGCCN
ncbi:hypothetical protein ACXHV2_004792 [Escherichia coli]